MHCVTKMSSNLAPGANIKYKQGNTVCIEIPYSYLNNKFSKDNTVLFKVISHYIVSIKSPEVHAANT